MSMVVKIYRSYKFKGQDPVVDQIKTMVTDSGLDFETLHKKSGVCIDTLRNWYSGTVRRPQSATVEAVGRAMGHARKWVKANDLT